MMAVWIDVSKRGFAIPCSMALSPAPEAPGPVAGLRRRRKRRRRRRRKPLQLPTYLIKGLAIKPPPFS